RLPLPRHLDPQAHDRHGEHTGQHLPGVTPSSYQARGSYCPRRAGLPARDVRLQPFPEGGQSRQHLTQFVDLGPREPALPTRGRAEALMAAARLKGLPAASAGHARPLRGTCPRSVITLFPETSGTEPTTDMSNLPLGLWGLLVAPPSIFLP